MNVDVRTAAGLDGAVVILSAWCQTCNEHAMPSARGLCMFCDRLIYTASGGAVGDPAVTSSADFPDVVGMAPRGYQVKEAAHDATPLLVPPPPKVKGRPVIPSGDIVAALQACAADLGHAPNSHEWLLGGVPSLSTIFRRYGSWRAALAAAGLT